MAREIEVFEHIILNEGECYSVAFYTRKIDFGRDIRYYTTNKLRYVGKFVRYGQYNNGYGALYAIFDDNGKEIKISIQEKTAFSKEDCRRVIRPEIREELVDTVRRMNNIPRPLSTTAHHALSTSEIAEVRKYETDVAPRHIITKEKRVRKSKSKGGKNKNKKRKTRKH
jgi:hypothetical protein